MSKVVCTKLANVSKIIVPNFVITKELRLLTFYVRKIPVYEKIWDKSVLSQKLYLQKCLV